MQPIAGARPTPVEVLQACSIPDTDTWLDKQFGVQESGGTEKIYVSFSDHDPSNNLSCQNKRTNLLHSFCGSIFPSYFKQVYELIGKIKLCNDGLQKVKILRENIDTINQLPVEGISLALPHLLHIVGDSRPFRSKTVIRKCSKDQEDLIDDMNSELSRQSVIFDYPIIIDVLGARLGTFIFVI